MTGLAFFEISGPSGNGNLPVYAGHRYGDGELDGAQNYTHRAERDYPAQNGKENEKYRQAKPEH